MTHSFLQDREVEADWQPDALELPLVEPWPRPLQPTTIDIDAPEILRLCREDGVEAAILPASGMNPEAMAQMLPSDR